MYLSRFGVKNYKCLGDIDIPLTPIHVLIGENDAGKTSLIEAIAAFHHSSRQKLRHAFPSPWVGQELLFHRTTDPRVELSGQWEAVHDREPREVPSALKYGFRVSFPTEGSNCRLDAEWVHCDGRDEDVALVSTQSTGLCAWKTGQAPAQFAPPDGLRVVSKRLKPPHHYALDARVMAVPAAMDPRRKFRLDPDGFGLPTLLLDLLANDPDNFIQLRTQFCGFFPQFRNVRVETESAVLRTYDQAGGTAGSGTGVGSGIYFETTTGQTVRAQQASDGAILFLGVLALAHLPDPPNLLLIEEPENGIYPKRLGELITMLRDLVQRTYGVRFPQIILSTHSPYVLSFFEPEEVTFLSRRKGRPDAPVRARPLREAPNIKERLGDDFYLGELWYNLSEEDLFGEP